MGVAANDVNVISVETADLDIQAGHDIEVTVEAEVGQALHGSGAKFRVRMTMTDRTDPALLNQQDVVANYSDPEWPLPGRQTFTFTVPGAVTAGRDGNLIEPQARVIGNAAAPFDVSSVVGELITLSP
jgi:hypothetical protein